MTFIDYIENLYQSLDIYRAIILVKNNNDIKLLLSDLKKNNHNPLIITNETNEINYNYRLFIINNFNIIQKFKKDSFNLIIVY